MVGCQDKEAMAELEMQNEASGLPGFIFSEPAPNRDEKIQILIHYDMEGLSGQDDWRTAFSMYEQYKKGQELLTADVNAVIGGLSDGGADEIYVIDGHGSGNRNPDIILEKMDSRAKFVSWSDIPEGTTLPEYYGIDAVAAVGHHSKTGGGGFMAHTRTLGMDFTINGRSVNETELKMLDYGTDENIPLIFAAGDDKLKEQLQHYPWIEYVTVKFATSASTADLRPVEEVHEEMRVAASKAVKNIPKSKAVKLKIPFKAGLRAVPPASLSILRRLPGINYQNETVTFEAKDYWDARRNGWVALVRIAITGHYEVKWETLWEILDDSRKIGKEVMNNLYMRWLDYESGRWKPQKQ
jgi:D-amino peptidase